MVKRSLQASKIGIQIAKKAFNAKRWTQENLAYEAGIKTRQPIWRFFTGKPVDRHIFMEVCAVLEIDWRQIAQDVPAKFGSRELLIEQKFEINNLVERVRSLHNARIQSQCGTISLLDVNRSVSIRDIYIDVNILSKIASKQWLEFTDLENIEPDQFDRFGMGDITQSQISGMEAVKQYQKLRVLGKPGIGKTTFLQHLAIECNLGNFAPHQVPIFISLHIFATESRAMKEFSLFKYMCQELALSGINLTSVEQLLQAGRILLLMDGLDEVLIADATAVLKEIRRFSDIYFKNQFVTTCRTASQRLSLQGFTDVEVAPFNDDQIQTFAQKWFVAFSDRQAGKIKSDEFIEKLEQPINWKFRRLVNTPLFLHLACWVFYVQNNFPKKRSEFYKQGLDLLLGRWDEQRGIERDEIYGGFLLPQKLKMFSQIAAATFEEGHYFFAQPQLEEQIGTYLAKLPNASSESDDIKYESESILRSIEVQHGVLAERAIGIFSFSYLAFHEYFTARNIVANYNLLTVGESLENLVGHLTEPRWREIFLLTTSMLRSADSLMHLMKKQIDTLVQQDSYLQEFLTWASQKSFVTPLQPKVATVRAFYLALSRTPHVASHFALASTLDQGMILDVALDHLMTICIADCDVAHAHLCGVALENILVSVVDLGLYKSLEQISNQFPHSQNSGSAEKARFKLWWEEYYRNWTEELKTAIASHRNINHSWQFSPQQQQTLQNYYDANQLLLDCLSSNCEVTNSVREEIEATLLLPQRELEANEWK